jgi:negative regulator of sigma E activity
MKITDEQLSAFIDAELPHAEMEIIREQLLENETLADRLAELALVDELVASSAKQIDSLPMPLAATELVQKKSAEIIAFPFWQRVQRSLQQPAALAASVALLVGFGVSFMMNKDSTQSDWSAVAQVLETAPSGVTQIATNGAEITPRITFNNHQGNYCRQFALSDGKTHSENIACRQAGQWQLSGTAVQQQSQLANEYQTASGGSALDETIEKMAAGEFFNAQKEATVINNKWSVKP